MANIKFHRLVISPVYGSCAPGDVLRGCSPEFARHCVDDLKAAEHLDAPKQPKPTARKKANKQASSKRG